MSAKTNTIFFILLFLINTLIFANPTYRMSIEEISVLSSSKIQASVYIENVGDNVILTSYQCALSINQTLDLSSLSLKYVEESSELLNEPDLYVGIDNIDGPSELTFVSYIGSDIISKKTLVGKFTLEGNIDISNINLLDIQWDFEGTISTIITGKDFENITDPAGHISIFGDPEEPAETTSLNIVNVAASSTTDENTSPQGVIDGLCSCDGDENARWATQGMPASLMFDLGQMSQISGTRISFYNFAEGRIYQYNIKVSSDNENWTTVLENVNSKSEEWSNEEFSSIDGRYVELEILSSTGPNTGNWANVWEVEIWGIGTPKSVEEEEEVLAEETIPSEYGISQNYPNPFNPTTNVKVMMKESGSAVLNVFNLLGEKVESVLDEELSAGEHVVSIDGSRLASGMYIYQLIVDNKFTQVKRMNLIK
jgi:hypothetical protein